MRAPSAAAPPRGSAASARASAVASCAAYTMAAEGSPFFGFFDTARRTTLCVSDVGGDGCGGALASHIKSTTMQL